MLSFSENNGIHKRALIDRKGMTRLFLHYGSTANNFLAGLGLFYLYWQELSFRRSVSEEGSHC